MATLQSVGIQITETDLTPVTQPVSASIGAYVGHFNWGPVDEITTVTSERALGEIFGAPRKSTDKTAASFLTAESFLKYGNVLKVIRACSSSSLNASSGTGLHIKNLAAFENLVATPAEFYARYPGTLGNSLKIMILHANNTESSDTANITLSKKYFSVLPTTTVWGTDQGYTNDEIHIVITDEDGDITGVKGAVLETWQGLSLNSEARNTNGTTNYYADVLNSGSQYVYAGSGSISTEALKTYTLTDDTGISLTDGSNVDPLMTAVTASLELLKDVDNTDVNLIFAEAFANDTTATINNKLAEVITTRTDSIAFLSAPVDLATKSSDSVKLSAIKAAKSAVNTTDRQMSYTVFDSTPVYVYNRYSDRYEWIPACGHIAGLCAYTDEIADPWFSPAGLNRGQLRGVVKLAYNPTSADRDELYNSNINPIVNLAGQGILLYGDKTGQTRPSAFDRINVRRLFITIQRVIANAAKYQLFELNDEFTRSSFISTVEPYLRDVQGRRGITDYKVVCDETNNTAQVIDTNRFVADIYIKPARSINYISLNFIASRTGISFTEIGA